MSGKGNKKSKDSSKSSEKPLGDDDPEEVPLRFVIPAGLTELTVSETLSTAFCLAEDEGLKPSWVAEEEVLNISPTKTDVFVMDPFSGPAFDHLTQGDKYRCTVIGPRCLTACLKAGIQVPNLPYPMYNTAMNGLKITCSGLEKDDKEKMKQTIEKMAGVCSSVFHDGITHLISNNVTSKKYQFAVSNEIPVMTPDWVEKVWEVSCHDYVTAVDPRFLQYRCPPFQNLHVCVSQLSRSDKHLLQSKIESNGGSYSPELNMDSTNLLVCLSSTGPKYQYAQKWKIPCVLPQWVMDSIDKGFALPTTSYKVDRGKDKASTPTREDTSRASLSEVSMCSTILNPEETSVNQSKVDETVNSTAIGNMFQKEVPTSDNTKELLQELDLARVKKSGHFLDNLKIYLSGFDDEAQVLLTRVLKFSGATRFTQLVESITHVVHSPQYPGVLPETQRLIRDLHLNPHSVGLEWIVESMKRGVKAPEDDFIFPPVADKPKPSRENLTPKKAGPGEVAYESEILAEYREDDTTMQNSTQATPFFNGRKFELYGLSEDLEQELTEFLTETGAELVFRDFEGVVDFVITCIHSGPGKHKYRHHLTTLWLDDCIDNFKIMDILYYHKPLPAEPLDVLSGVVTCVSGYTGREREYISALVAHLGGNPQEMLAKRDKEEAKASTHLICPLPEGQKYTVSLKWGICITTKDWLIACLHDSAWVSEEPFLVGKATVFSKDKPKPRPIPPDEPINLTNFSPSEQNDSTILQEIDQNQKESRVPERRQSNSSFKADKTTKTDLLAVAAGRSDYSTPISRGNLTSARNSLETPGVGIDTPTLQRLRPKPLQLETSVTPQHWPESQPSPSQQQGGGSCKRKRDADGEMQTPNTPYGGHLFENPQPETRKYYKRVMNKLSNLRTEPSEMERWRQKANQWINKRPGAQPELKEKNEREEVISNFREKRLKLADDIKDDDPDGFKNNMDEKLEKIGLSWTNMEQVAGQKARQRLQDIMRGEIDEKEESRKEGVLAGTVIYIAAKLQKETADLSSIVNSLGGKVVNQLDHEGVTHLIFQGKPKDTNKEFRTGLEMEIKIVSPHWLHMCWDENTRVDEDLFPHSYNPKMNRTENKNASTANTTLKGKRTRSTQGKKMPPPLVFSDEENEKMDHHSDQTIDLNNDKDVSQNPLDDSGQEDAANVTRKEEITQGLKAFEELLDSVKKTPITGVSGTVKEKQRELNAADVSKIPLVKNKPDKESQVMWVDPEEEQQHQNLASKMKLDTQKLDSMEMETLGSINLTEVLDQMDSKNTTRVFLSTGIAEDINLTEAVTNLGGRILESKLFDAEVTHIIAGMVTRSEKILGGIASGKWILHPSYVEESVTAGKWLKEEDFEWGNPQKNFIHPDNLETIEGMLAKAASRTRKAASNGELGIFSGMKAVLAMNPNKKGAFSRLLEAGGGEIQEHLTDNSMSGLTHVFSDPKCLVFVKNKFKALCDKGVPVLDAIYLNDFLTKNRQLNVDDYILGDYRDLWEERKKNRISTDTPTNSNKRSRRKLSGLE